MFDQTFVEAARSSKKPASLAVSLAFQLCVVCTLVLIPLLYTQGLPGVMLKSFLLAPRLPHAAIPEVRATTNPERLVIRNFHPWALVLTKARSQVSAVPDAAAPDLQTGQALSASSAENMGGVQGVIGSVSEIGPPLLAEPQAKAKPAAGPVHIGGAVAEANLIHKVVPPYPALAKSARVQGAVEFRAVISKDGNIERLQLIRGHPLLVASAKEAVLQWKYRPTLLNGTPVEVVTDIIVSFTLSQ